MGRKVALSIVGPDSEDPLFTLATHPIRAGETIDQLISRTNMDVWSLPTIVRVNGRAVYRRDWSRRRIRGRDHVVFLARPGGGAMGGMGGGGGGGAKSIGAIVGLVALTVLAPWAGGALAGAIGLGGATLGGVAYASIFSGIILAGGSLLLSQFMKPKAGGNSDKQDDIFSISASGNTARPQQLIPVGYGQRLNFPDFAAPPYSEYQGNDMYLYELFAITCGSARIEKLLVDDTIMWTRTGGFHPAFAGCQLEIVDPGENVDLFPINIVTASEVSGNELQSPSKDPLNNGWIGGFVVNPSDTLANQIWLDIVLPSGASVTYKDKTLPTYVGINAQARTVDGAGVPVGAWFDLIDKTYTFNSDQQIRITEKVTVPQGRYMVRMRRTNESITGDDNVLGAAGKIKGHDDVQWGALRARILGPRSFPGVTTLALKAKADQNLTSVSGRRLAVVATRILPVWNGATWSDQPTRNPVWAALDIWRNADYGPGLSLNNVDFQTFYQYAVAFDAAGHTFDHFFTDRTSVAEAIETALRPVRSNPAFIGDRMLMVRDEVRPVSRLAFTDNNIVRGSLSIKRNLLDEEWADGVVVEYFDERNWKVADVTSAPEGVVLQRPARVQIPGLTKRSQAVGLARHLGAVNARRRLEISFEVELEGRMLKRMDQILVSSNLPQTWGQGGRMLSYDVATRRMTLDFAPAWDTASATHWVRIKRSNGRPWGPVRVTEVAGQPNVLSLNGGDIAVVEAQSGVTVAAAMDREDTQELLDAVFSPGTPKEMKILVTRGQMRGRNAVITGVVDDPLVYTMGEDGVPVIPPDNPNFEPAYPLIRQLAARAYQKGATVILQVGWAPTPGAVKYVIGVSLDGGAIWNTIYNGELLTIEANVGGARSILVRGAVVPMSGRTGNYSIIAVEVPPLIISNSFFIMEIQPDDLKSQIRRDVEFQRLIQPVAIVGATAQVVAQQSNSRALAAIKRAEEVAVSSTEAIATVQLEMQAKFDSYDATFVQITQTFADQDQAITTLQTTLTSQMEDVVADVNEIIQTRVTASEATALAETVVSAKVGDIGAVTVKQTFDAVATRIGQLTGRYSVVVTTDNYWSGFEIITETGTPGTIKSEFKIATDKFLVGAPGLGYAAENVFSIGTRGGVARVAISGDLIVDKSVNAAHINVGSLSALSANMGLITLGQVNFGQVRIIGGDWGGPRIEVWDS